MKVFIDTNIILGAICSNRPFAQESKQILLAAKNKRIKGCISAGSFHTVIYITEKEMKLINASREERIARQRNLLTALLKSLNVIKESGSDLERAVLNPEFLDLEDSCQYQAALKANCDYLVTINTKDFQDCTGKTVVLHPVDFVKVLDEQED